MANTDNTLKQKALLATPIQTKVGQGTLADGYLVTSTQEVRFSKTGICKLLGRSSNWINQFNDSPDLLEELKRRGYSGIALRLLVVRPNKKGATIVEGLSLQDVETLIKVDAMRGNPRAIALFAGESGLKLKKRLSTRPERSVQLQLQAKLGGSVEVSTPAGNIDLLTSNEIIEVKKVKSWKDALGQVLVYGRYYPSHQKRVHLFGDCHEAYLVIVEEHLRAFEVKLTWQAA